MPYNSRECDVCKRIDAISIASYLLINTSECEAKLRTGYRFYFAKDLPDASLINSYVHRNCYKKVARKLPSIKPKKQKISTNVQYSTDAFSDVLSNESNVYVAHNDLHIEEEVNVKIL